MLGAGSAVARPAQQLAVLSVQVGGAAVVRGVFVGALAQGVVGIAGNGQAVDVHRLQPPLGIVGVAALRPVLQQVACAVGGHALAADAGQAVAVGVIAQGSAGAGACGAAGDVGPGAGCAVAGSIVGVAQGMAVQAAQVFAVGKAIQGIVAVRLCALQGAARVVFYLGDVAVGVVAVGAVPQAGDALAA